jgi:hypothetical protein
MFRQARYRTGQRPALDAGLCPVRHGRSAGHVRDRSRDVPTLGRDSQRDRSRDTLGSLQEGKRDSNGTRSEGLGSMKASERERRPLSWGVRHSWTAAAGIDWRSRPDLDELADDAFLAVIRDAWTPERRAAAGARRRARRGAAWTPERRAAASAMWRADHPGRGAIRDAILAGSPEEPCDRCGADAARLWVVDHATADHVWRCESCASAARAGYHHRPEVPA